MEYSYEEKYIFNKAKNKKKDYLGGGGFGEVYKAVIKGTTDIRAIKIIDKNKIRQMFIDYYIEKHDYHEPTEQEVESYIDEQKEEIKIMKTMQGENNENENTVKFYESFDYDDILIIVMEYCQTNLKEFFAKRKASFKVEEIRELLMQLNNSFKIMYKNRISHRDLSLDNILIQFKNDDMKNSIFKLSDYGISKKLSNLKSKFSTKVGKFNFMAPEVLNISNEQNEEKNEKENQDKNKNKYDEKCDLWSLGIIIHILFFRKPPYSGDTEISVKNHINLFQQKNIQNTGDELLNDLLKRLLDKNPKTRITWEEYFKHSFFNNNRQSNNIILITIKVGKKDKKGNEFNDIYFLDNKPNMIKKIVPLYKENFEINNLKDNEVQIFIEGNPQKKFSKFFKPDNEKDYEIKIVFKKKIKDCSFMFSGCDNIKKIDLSNFDSSEVTNMHYMFGKCHYLKEIVLNNLNTENVTDMSYMFSFCHNLEKIKFPKPFNTKKVTNIESMFYNCMELTDISFGDFNTGNVKSMKALFKNCYKLKTLDLSKFNTSKVIDMRDMFNNCIQLEELLINQKTFITKETINMARMFELCKNLKNINLLTFNTEKVEYLNKMFHECENLKYLDLSNLNILDNTILNNMFDGCCNLEIIDLSSLKIGGNNKIDNMFDQTSKLKKIKVNENSIKIFKTTFKEIENKFVTN